VTRRVVITGVDGFLGWHLSCRLRAMGTDTVVGLARAELADHASATEALARADAVVHLAGVNRGTENDIEAGNQRAAQQLIDACDQGQSTPHLVYADSIHHDGDSAYGRGKRAADELFQTWARMRGTTYADVRLPNLFGEHGRPYYNSVVATFCHELARGEMPIVTGDAEIPLLHAQAAAAELIDASTTGAVGVIEPAGRPTRVTALRDQLVAQATCYTSGDIPDLSDGFARDLFNTYRSYTFPHHFPMPITGRLDERGALFECVRAHGGTGQTFVSSSRPDVTRGDHFHLHKVERFVVIAGKGQIRLRRLLTDEVVTFDVGGDTPVIVDMPTMWSHSVVNTGPDDLITLFWSDELFDPEHSDTYAEPVVGSRELSMS